MPSYADQCVWDVKAGSKQVCTNGLHSTKTLWPWRKLQKCKRDWIAKRWIRKDAIDLFRNVNMQWPLTKLRCRNSLGRDSEYTWCASLKQQSALCSRKLIWIRAVFCCKMVCTDVKKNRRTEIWLEDSRYASCKVHCGFWCHDKEADRLELETVEEIGAHGRAACS